MSFEPSAAIAALRPWDVIYPFDDRIKPEKHKMWVCVSKPDMWFLRINSKDYGSGVLLTKAANPYLAYDSYFGVAGDLVGLVEVELERLLARQVIPNRQGIIGRIDKGSRSEILQALLRREDLTQRQKNIIRRELSPC